MQEELEGFKDVYLKIQELEKQIAQQPLASYYDETSSNHREILSLYHDILHNYPCIVVAKNIDTLLWKKCFHCHIVKYREEIKKLTALVDSKDRGRGKTGGYIAQSYSQYMREEELLHLSSSLDRFLAHVSAFYQKLIFEFENRRNMISTDDAYITRQIYFSLLYLGDVARYAELHSASSKQKDWSVSERYYNRARQTIPSVGNTYNQLAVLASYSLSHSPTSPSSNRPSTAVAELAAVYFYSRSILNESPFKTGVENLRKVYEKNNRRLSQHFHHNSQTCLLKRDGTLMNLTVSTFLSRFVFVNGLLFYLALTEMNDATAHRSIDSQPNYGLDMSAVKAQKLIRDHIPALMKDLELLLRAPIHGQQGLLTGGGGNDALLRMVAICLFSLHFRPTGEAKRREEEACNGGGFASRSAGESLSLLLLFGMINKFCQAISSTDTVRRGRSKAPRRCTSVPSMMKVNALLQAVSIFCEWGSGVEGMKLLRQVFRDGGAGASQSSALSSIDPGSTSTSSSWDLLREENRARSALRVALTAVANNCVVPGGNKLRDSTDTDLRPLPEHIELRGFSPFQSALESYFVGRRDNEDDNEDGQTQKAVEKNTRTRRLLLICCFLSTWDSSFPPTSAVHDHGATASADDKYSRSGYVFSNDAPMSKYHRNSQVKSHILNAHSRRLRDKAFSSHNCEIALYNLSNASPDNFSPDLDFDMNADMTRSGSEVTHAIVGVGGSCSTKEGLLAMCGGHHDLEDVGDGFDDFARHDNEYDIECDRTNTNNDNNIDKHDCGTYSNICTADVNDIVNDDGDGGDDEIIVFQPLFSRAGGQHIHKSVGVNQKVNLNEERLLFAFVDENDDDDDDDDDDDGDDDDGDDDDDDDDDDNDDGDDDDDDDDDEQNEVISDAFCGS